MILKIIASTIFYGACVYGSYKYTQEIYSKGGKYELSNPSVDDLIFVLIPLVNFLPASEYFINNTKRECPNKLIKLFKIKR